MKAGNETLIIENNNNLVVLRETVNINLKN